MNHTIIENLAAKGVHFDEFITIRGACVVFVRVAMPVVLGDQLRSSYFSLHQEGAFPAGTPAMEKLLFRHLIAFILRLLVFQLGNAAAHLVYDLLCRL